MDKAQFYYQFWSQFGWPAYDESTVPEVGSNAATLPYITYMVVEDDFEHPVYPNASLWDRSTSWARVSQKAKQISDAIGYGGQIHRIDNGLVWVQRGHPFAQRVSDDDDTIRRIILNIDIEFFTES